MRINVSEGAIGFFDLNIDYVTLSLDHDQTSRLYRALGEALAAKERRRGATERYFATEFDRLVDLPVGQLEKIVGLMDFNSVVVMVKLAERNLPFIARLTDVMSPAQRDKISELLQARFLDGVPESLAEETMHRLADIIDRLAAQGEISLGEAGRFLGSR